MTTTNTKPTTNERVALVTGGNRGLGLATARRLGREGVTVVIGARDETRARAAVLGLREAGVWASAVPLDVDDDASVTDAAERIRREHGRLDILVNNAGILPEATATDAVDPLDPDLFWRTFRTNVLGAVAVTAAVLPLLLESDRGRVVNVSSRMGSLSDQLDPASPYHSLVVPAYQSSKAALNGLTIALAKKLAGTTVKVNAVCPGWVQTDLGGPDNRAAAPTPADEAAEVVARAALMGEAGPSGSFFDADGPVPW
ncbi:SDR family NAD(P)-dependent oxidoreductase [Nocardioides sp. QY071]|uniref:SDR family NAD(P)-dependent oxidoreductase n=1 Tax=Nocardioides sp. QY071 TaxID=3044187 RepID=UPI00249C44B8|nr:SDR family NAD(P)-dependent oxidoreductase [Nocardioides sp. QY071]WGY02139.1 SDR family NAD(P)-dependent oxidoreductase [Nocardioides sp. QY071]